MSPSINSISLIKANWQAIQQIISEYCQTMNNEWITWSESINASISTVIDHRIKAATLETQQYLELYHSYHSIIRNNASRLRHLIERDFGNPPEPGRPLNISLQEMNIPIQFITSRYGYIHDYEALWMFMTFATKVHGYWSYGLVDDSIVPLTDKVFVEDATDPHTSLGADMSDLLLLKPVDELFERENSHPGLISIGLGLRTKDAIHNMVRESCNKRGGEWNYWGRLIYIAFVYPGNPVINNDWVIIEPPKINAHLEIIQPSSNRKSISENSADYDTQELEKNKRKIKSTVVHKRVPKERSVPARKSKPAKDTVAKIDRRGS